jgi:hypothetical protein
LVPGLVLRLRFDLIFTRDLLNHISE